jgi:hypothetical protein
MWGKTTYTAISNNTLQENGDGAAEVIATVPLSNNTVQRRITDYCWLDFA